MLLNFYITMRNIIFTFLTLSISLGFGLACDGGLLPNGNYTVGGTLTSLEGTLILQNNSTDNLTLTSKGNFTFSKSLTTGDTYSVTVSSQPDGQTCTVTNGTGTMEKSNITNVMVTCSSSAPSTYTIGGTLSGLPDGIELVLANNKGDTIPLTENGVFAFSTEYSSGEEYQVGFEQRPYGSLLCRVTDNQSGVVENANVTDITISCDPVIRMFSSDNPLTAPDIFTRANADSICQAASVTQGLTCMTSIRAFISMASNDEVRDMPDNYGVPTDVQILGGSNDAIQKDWAGLLSGTIFTTLNSVSVTGSTWWSGSNSDGSISNSNCGLWTVPAGQGTVGFPDQTDSQWIDGATHSCGSSEPILCLCY